MLAVERLEERSLLSITPASIITTVLSNLSLGSPSGMAVSSGGDLVFDDTWNNRVEQLDPQGAVTLVAGSGPLFQLGDGGPATDAALSLPTDVSFDSAGDLFICDSFDDRIRKVDRKTGVISTVAGGGSGSDGVPATDAKLNSPAGITVDSSGNLFIADKNEIREVAAGTTIISRFAGNPNLGPGYSGDNGPATAAQLDGPSSVALDKEGDLFIADTGNNVVREVNHVTSVITTVAGDGKPFYGGDGGPATAASLWAPGYLAFDADGNLFIADSLDGRVRKVDHLTHVITTVAGGNNFVTNLGDGGPAGAAELSDPVGLAFDQYGNLFVADFSSENRIREIASIRTATNTVLSSSAEAAVYRQPVTFTATVESNVGGAGTPAGTVTFMDNGNPLQSVPLDATGAATLTISNLSVGSHAITTSYAGNADFTGSSVSVAETVNRDPTNTAMTASATTSVYGQPLSFTVTVSAAMVGSGTPTGTVTFQVDGVSVSGGPLGLKAGKATFTTAGLSAVSHTITALYSGDATFSTSDYSLTQTVSKAAVTAKVATSAASTVFGQRVTFTATVAAKAPGAGMPTGMMTFLDGSVPLGTVALSGGKAALSVSSLGVAGHTVTASYGGDGNFAAGTATVSQKVARAATKTAITASANPVSSGQPVGLTVTVTAKAPGAGTPTGTVTIKDGSVTLGTVSLSGGTATLMVPDLSAATHKITAMYIGDEGFLASTTALKEVVRKAVRGARSPSMRRTYRLGCGSIRLDSHLDRELTEQKLNLDLGGLRLQHHQVIGLLVEAHLAGPARIVPAFPGHFALDPVDQGRDCLTFGDEAARGVELQFELGGGGFPRRDFERVFTQDPVGQVGAQQLDQRFGEWFAMYLQGSGHVRFDSRGGKREPIHDNHRSGHFLKVARDPRKRHGLGKIGRDRLVELGLGVVESGREQELFAALAALFFPGRSKPLKERPELVMDRLDLVHD